MENLIYIPLILLPVSGIAYLLLIHKLPFTGAWAIKATPALCLAVLSLAGIAGVWGYLLCAGFVLSAIGDISLSFKTEKHFIGGLVSFLLAHVMYIITFSIGSPWSIQFWWLLALIGMFGISMLYVLTPHLGAMKIPVFVYMAVILTMDVMAVMHGSEGVLVISGALIFTASDSILALNKFRKPIPAGEYLVMTTYYTGQTLIFLGIWAEHVHFRLC